MKKVELIIKPDSGWRNEKLPLPVHLAKAPPFYLAGKGRYIHRVKSAVLRENRGAFISVTLWCGASGFISDRRHGRFLDDPSACELPCCATCEGRAIGAGWDGAREIAGRPVMFSPLLNRAEAAAIVRELWPVRAKPLVWHAVESGLWQTAKTNGEWYEIRETLMQDFYPVLCSEKETRLLSKCTFAARGNAKQACEDHHQAQFLEQLA